MEHITDRIDEAYDTLSPRELETFLCDLCDEMESEYGSVSSEFITACNELGTFYRGRSRYQEGEATYLKALSCMEALVGKNDAYATCLDNLAELYRLKGDYVSCEKCLLEAELIFSDTKSAEYAACLNYKGHLAAARRDLEGAKDCYLRSLAIIEPLSPNSIDLATGYQNVANAFQALGDIKSASDYLEKAVAMYRDGDLAMNAHYVSVLNQMGSLRLSLGNTAAAEAAFDAAVDAIDKTTISPLDALVVLTNAASLYRKLAMTDKYESALSRIDEFSNIASIADNPLVGRIKALVDGWRSASS